MSAKRSVASTDLDDIEKFPVHTKLVKTSSALWKQCVDKADVCDVTINFKPIDADQFPDGLKAHWCVLVQCPYFKALYDSGLREKSTAVLTLDVVHPEIALLALKFIYLQAVEADWKQLTGLITVADYLQLDALSDACCESIANNQIIDKHNCVEFLSLALQYKMPTLRKAAENVLVANFEKVAKHPSMMETSPDFLVALMKNPDLKRMRAMKFFDLIVRWVDGGEERQKHFPRLFACLNFKDFVCFDFGRVSENRYVRESPECEALCEKYAVRLYERNKSGNHNLSDYLKDVIVLTGTRENEKSNRAHCYAYDIKDNHWTRLAHPPESQHQTLAVVRGNAYLCGLKEQPDDEFFYEDDRSMELFQLRPSSVKVKWDTISCDNVEWPSFRVLACAEMKDGGMVTVRQSKDSNIKLKIDLPGYVEWGEKLGRSNPGMFIVPESQQTSVTYDLVTAPEISRIGAFGKKFMEVKKVLVVCGEEEIFIYVHFTDVTKTSIIMAKEFIFVYNTSTRAVTGHPDRFPDLLAADIAYLEDNKVHLEGYDNKTSYAFNLEDKSWETKTRGLPRLPKKPKDYSIAKHNDDVYIIALTGNKKDSINTLYKLNRNEHSCRNACWERLSVLPEPGLTKTLCCVMTDVHKRKVWCPVDCSECSSKLRTNYYAASGDFGKMKVVEPHADN